MENNQDIKNTPLGYLTAVEMYYSAIKSVGGHYGDHTMTAMGNEILMPGVAVLERLSTPVEVSKLNDKEGSLIDTSNSMKYDSNPSGIGAHVRASDLWEQGDDAYAEWVEYFCEKWGIEDPKVNYVAKKKAPVTEKKVPNTQTVVTSTQFNGGLSDQQMKQAKFVLMICGGIILFCSLMILLIHLLDK